MVFPGRFIAKTCLASILLVFVMFYTLGRWDTQLYKGKVLNITSDAEAVMASNHNSSLEITILDWKNLSDNPSSLWQSTIYPQGQIANISSLGADPPYGWRAWDGNNPFHQPAATTN